MRAERSDLPGWLLPAGLALLVGALVVVALVRGPTTFDPDTPEGTVQEYLIAIDEERWEEAVEVLHEEWRGSCGENDLAASAPGSFTAELGGGDRFGGPFSDEFIAVPREPGQPPLTVPDDAARVEVTIRRDEGWTEHASFELVNEGDFWWLVGNPWPHFVWNCRGGS